jgi:hypothetical protein
VKNGSERQIKRASRLTDKRSLLYTSNLIREAGMEGIGWLRGRGGGGVRLELN